MRQYESKLASHQVDVKVVTFDADILALAYVRKSKLRWPLLLDTEKKLYRAYGFESGSWWTIYNPLSILRYLLVILRGVLPGKPGSDWWQLGGDVVIDPDGIVRLHHVSQNAFDHPPVEFLVKLVTRTGRRDHSL